jgi:hypothetical protein
LDAAVSAVCVTTGGFAGIVCHLLQNHREAGGAAIRVELPFEPG